MATSLAFALFEILKLFHRVTGNWVVDIVLLTLTLKLALHPSTRNQMFFSRKIQKLQPQIKKFDELKKNPDKQKGMQEYKKAVMDLYQKEGLNPASGCLPLFIQLPVMFGLFLMLRSPEVNGGIMEKTKLFGIPLSQVPYSQLTQLPLPGRYEDRGTSADRDYSYRIVVVKDGKDAGTSEVSAGRRVPASGTKIPSPPPPYQLPSGYDALYQPRDLHATDGQFPDHIEVRFKVAKGATKNELFRAESESGPYTALPQPQDFTKCNCLYRDTKIDPGKTYWYRLDSTFGDGHVAPSNEDPGYSGKDAPFGVQASKEYADGILVTWKHAIGGEQYRVERAESAGGPFQPVATLLPDISPYTIRIHGQQGGTRTLTLIYWPGIFFIALYAVATWFYQKQFSKMSGSANAPPNPAMPNMNMMSFMLVAFSVFYPFGLILYFISFSTIGIIESEIIARWLQAKDGPAPVPEKTPEKRPEKKKRKK